MAIEHHVLTLSGAAQQLSEVLADQTPGGIDDIPLRTVSLQPRGTNGNPVYVGATSSVSASDFGVRLEPGATGVPPAPFMLEHDHAGPLRLANFWVIGTASQFLHILTVPF